MQSIFLTSRNNGAFQGIFLALALFVFSSCSPASFFGNSIDSEIKNQKQYRTINTECSTLQLNNSTLSVENINALVHCLNAHGAMNKTEQFLKEVQPSELEFLLDWFNLELISQPDAFGELDETIQNLETKQQWDEVLESFSYLFKNVEVFEKTFQLLKESQRSNEGQWNPEWVHFLNIVNDEIQVQSPQELRVEWNRWLKAIEIFVDNENFLEIQAKLFESSNDYSEEKLQLIKAVQSLGPLSYQFLEHYSLGYWDKAFENFQKAHPKQNDFQTALLSFSLLGNELFKNKGENVYGVQKIFSALRSQDILCNQESFQFKDPAVLMLSDIASRPPEDLESFVLKEQPLNILASLSLCSYPESVLNHYHNVAALVALKQNQLNAGVGLHQFLSAIHSVNSDSQVPLVHFVIQLFSEMKDILPVLSQLHDENLITPALLMITQSEIPVSPKQAEKMLYRLELPKIISSLRSKSSLLSQMELLNALGATMTKNGRKILPFSKAAQMFSQNNESAAGVRLLQSFARHSSKDWQRSLNALTEILKMPSFIEATEEWSQMMQKNDGRMKSVVQTLFGLFRSHFQKYHQEKYQLTIKEKISRLKGGDSFAVISPKARHRFTKNNLDELSELTPSFYFRQKNVSAVCFDNLVRHHKTLFSSWHQWSSVEAKTNFKQISDCLELNSVQNGLNALTDISVSDGSQTYSAWDYFVSVLGRLKFSRAEEQALMGELYSGLSGAEQYFQRMNVFLDQSIQHGVLKITKSFHGITQEAKALAGLSRLSLWMGEELEKQKAPKVVRSLVHLFVHSTDEPELSPKDFAVDRPRILRWVRNKECTLVPDGMPESIYLEARANELIDEYRRSVDHLGKRTVWTSDDLEPELEGTFKKLSSPEESGDLVGATLRFARRVQDEKEYPKHFLASFLIDHALDQSYLSYFYPGESKPRVRLVSSLDRMALLLLNADIFAPEPIGANIGLVFLSDLAEAWGDEPFEKWPEEIQRKFPKNGRKKPKKLKEAVSEMEETAQGFAEIVGYPPIEPCNQQANPADDPETQRRETTDPVSEATGSYPAEPGSEIFELQASLFNIAQLLPALKEAERSGHVKILRDLFFEYYYSTPEKFRNPESLDKNNLSVVLKMVRLGVFRQVTRLVRDAHAERTQMIRFIETFFKAARWNESNTLLLELTETEEKQKILKNLLKTVVDTRKENAVNAQKYFTFYGLLGLAHLEKQNIEVIRPAIASLYQIIREHRPFLEAETQLSVDIASNRKVVSVLRSIALEEYLYPHDFSNWVSRLFQNPEIGRDALWVVRSIAQKQEYRHQFEVGLEELNRLFNSDEMKHLELAKLADDFSVWIEKPENSLASRALLENISNELKYNNGASSQVLIQAMSHSEFEKVLQLLGQVSGDGTLNQFYQLISKGMSSRK